MIWMKTEVANAVCQVAPAVLVFVVVDSRGGWFRVDLKSGRYLEAAMWFLRMGTGSLSSTAMLASVSFLGSGAAPKESWSLTVWFWFCAVALLVMIGLHGGSFPRLRSKKPDDEDTRTED